MYSLNPFDKNINNSTKSYEHYLSDLNKSSIMNFTNVDIDKMFKMIYYYEK